ncbi:MAG TPA: biotin/lipoyl-containing protein, partial [Caulobacteraceae bacterium]
MSTDILMPALSPTMEEGSLAKWLVKVGDAVRSGDVIAEIETDKATMEVEAVDEGVVSEILVPEGTEGVKINTPIARLGAEGEAAKSKPEPAPKAEKTEAAPRTETAVAPSTPSGSPSPIGGGEEPALSPPSGGSTAKGREGGPASPKDGQRLFASPLARRLAAQLNVDLASVAGSGPHGRIIRRDVEALGGAKPAARPEAAAQMSSALAAQAPHKSLEQMGIAPG